VRANGTEGASYDYMQNYMDDVAKATADRVPEAHVMMTQVPGAGGGPGIQGAVNNGFVRIFLKDKSQRTRTQMQIAEELRSLQREFTGARVNITQEASIGERRSTNTGVQFVVQALDMEALRDTLPKFVEEVQQTGGACHHRPR
jgi:multidrug efflux pump